MSSEERVQVGAQSSSPRVFMPTLRRINRQAAWCSNYEFEDVVNACDDVRMVELEQGQWFDTRHRIARSLAWRGRHTAFTCVNPGLKPVVVDRDYDIFVFICMNVWDLLYLNSIRDWQTRCRVKICYMVEIYSGQASQYEHFLRTLSQFDHVFQSFSSSIAAVAGVTGKSCHHVPLAADVRRFSPFPRLPRRVIDVFSMGGRSAPVHEALLKFVNDRDLFYMYDTIPGALVKPSNGVQHRDLLANCAKRSRYFVAYEAKFGNRENEGQSEVGARYFEGAAAGAVLLGRVPNVPSFRNDFPWPDPVVEVSVDGHDVADVLDSLAARPDEIERMGARNALHALRWHDWSHRWKSILQIADFDPRPALVKRLQTLEALADRGRVAAADPTAGVWR